LTIFERFSLGLLALTFSHIALADIGPGAVFLFSGVLLLQLILLAVLLLPKRMADSRRSAAGLFGGLGAALWFVVPGLAVENALTVMPIVIATFVLFAVVFLYYAKTR
jgi:hypothetical protein